MIKLQRESNTLSSVINEYLHDYRAKGVTERTYFLKQRELNKLLEFLGDDDIESLDFKDYYISVLNNDSLSTTSKGTYLRSIKAFVRWVNEKKNISITEPTIVKEEVIKDTYTNEELKKLITKPKRWKNFAEYRTWLIIMLLVDTGMRSGTIRNIKVEDVNLTEKFIITKHNKTKVQQIVPISSTLANELSKFLKYSTEWLFPDQFGNQLSESALKQSVKRYNLSRGVEKTSVHLFRHTFAKRYLLEMNGDAFRLQKLLGHTSLAMTRHYCNIYDRELLKVYESTSPLELLTKRKISI